jgi:glycosyltransferase involved in cell wall biosynthesis
MRIVELVNSLEIGGAERMVADLARGLRRAGHDVHVAALRGRGPLAEVLDESGVEWHAFGKAEGFSFKTARALARYAGDRGADVIHTHNPLTHHYGAMAGRMAKTSVVASTFHGPGNLTGFGRTLLVFEASCLFSDCVVACCTSVEKHLRRVTRIARSRLTMIPNGIELDRFLNVAPVPRKGQLTFGAVGRLVAVKDQSSLIRAFAEASRVRPEARLEILGAGPLHAALVERARELSVADRVTFHGSSLDVASFLSRIDVFVLCSLSEGLPLTMLEAMAAGLPVVGTEVGEIPELVRGGSCGWLCAPSAPEQLARAMLEAAESERRAEMGQSGREYVVKRHSVDRMVTNYQELFKELLCASRERAA